MVVEVARTVRDLCDDIALPAYAKTSGSTGMHVLVPLGRSCTYAQCKQLGELLARVTASRIPDLATTARALDARKGRVYIDFVQNGHGKLLVSPLCVRPLPGAPVSMPVHWEEVNADLDLRDYTIVSAPKRMQALRVDPMADVLREQPDLLRALSALARVVE